MQGQGRGRGRGGHKHGSRSRSRSSSSSKGKKRHGGQQPYGGQGQQFGGQQPYGGQGQQQFGLPNDPDAQIRVKIDHIYSKYDKDNTGQLDES